MGEAGRIFNQCLSMTLSSFTFDLTNVLGCRPWRETTHGTRVNRPPSSQEIEACLPRVKDLLQASSYDGIIHLGDIPKQAVPLKNALSLKHPSAILRKEYKLYDIREFALKLDTYVNTISQAKLESNDGRNSS